MKMQPIILVPNPDQLLIRKTDVTTALALDPDSFTITQLEQTKFSRNPAEFKHDILEIIQPGTESAKGKIFIVSGSKAFFKNVVKAVTKDTNAEPHKLEVSNSNLSKKYPHKTEILHWNAEDFH